MKMLTPVGKPRLSRFCFGPPFRVILRAGSDANVMRDARLDRFLRFPETPMASPLQNMATTTKPLAELKLPPALKEAINSALRRGHPMSIAYVNADGRPELSFRGSLQTYGDTKLAIWVRNPESGVLRAVRAGRVHIAMLYGDPTSDAFVSFRGRGRVYESPEVRNAVYEHAPASERAADKQQKGVPLIIDLDSVEGYFAGHTLKMRR